MSNIQNAVNSLLKKHRLVFWYDENKEFHKDFEGVVLDGAGKIEVDRAGFGLKYRLLMEEQEQRFLLYFPFSEPAMEENFLLDLQLSNTRFSTDRASMYAQELNMPMQYKAMFDYHIAFFEAKDRRLKFLKNLSPDLSKEAILHAMLCTVFGTEINHIDQYLFCYAEDYLKDPDRLSKQLDRFNLSFNFWELVKQSYPYESEHPSIYDFLKLTFKRASDLFTDEADVKKRSFLLLRLWQDSESQRENYKAWAELMAKDLDLMTVLSGMHYKQLNDESFFKEPEVAAISGIANSELADLSEINDALEFVKDRRSSFWYRDFRDYFDTIEAALYALQSMSDAENIAFSSFSDGINAYTEKWYKVDYYYRKFIFHHRAITQKSIFEKLYTFINSRYSNTFLLNLSTAWQHLIDAKGWNMPSNIGSQRHFFQRSVESLLDKQRVVVIISDGLRYETAVELMERFKRENRYEAELSPAVSELPSYTQLGMAALLPHKELELAEKSTKVFADGLSTQGVQGRSKILQQKVPDSIAISADEMMRMPSNTEGREFVKQYNLIYVYHNAIDKMGDDKTTEHRVFDAVEEEFSFLMRLCKNLTNMNVTKMFITADHGFLYEHEPLAKSDFDSEGVSGGEIWNISRRFAMGRDLNDHDGCILLNSRDLSIKGDFEVLIPKFTNRFRVKGAGSRYVHGGASLQEVVIPVLEIRKKREDTARAVEVDIIKSTDKITGYILPITFIQSERVSDYVHARKLRAFLQADDGTVISDTFLADFDFDDDLDRHRQIKHSFRITGDAYSKYNKKYVKLILQEPVDRTNWRLYKEFVYILNIMSSSDFNFDL